MAKAQHTSGTWKAYIYNTHYVITAPDTANHEVLIVHMVRDPVVLSDTWERQCADARRIVAVVSACQGISDADLAGGVVAAVEVERLKAEHAIMRRRLIGYPDLKCVNCGYYTSGSGNWACRNCGKWHYWTGIDSDDFDPNSEWGSKWLAARTEKFDGWLAGRVAALNTQPGTDTATPVPDQTQGE